MDLRSIILIDTLAKGCSWWLTRKVVVVNELQPEREEMAALYRLKVLSY